jgi:hypothetical protein
VTERTHAHLRHDAHAADYGRVSFDMPSATPAPVVKLRLV